MVSALDESKKYAFANGLEPLAYHYNVLQGMVPFIDLAAQQRRIRRELEAAIGRVLDHGRYIMGPEIEALEAELAAFTGSKHCIACGSGTDALLMALMAWKIGPGCTVFTTPFTFVATAEVIRLVGAEPVYVDINPATFNIDPARLEDAILRVKAEGKRCPSAVITVDLFGHPCDYAAISEITQKHGLRLLQDAAQAFGALDVGRRCPAQGDIGATSFFPAKPLGGYGDSGAVFTDNDEWATAMRSVRIHGMGATQYENVRVGLNARMDTLQAAILLEKLKLYPEEIELRQRVAQTYAEKLAAVPGVTLPTVADGCTSVWAQYTVRSTEREALRARLKDAGYPTGVYYPQPIYRSEAYRPANGELPDCPECERTCAEVFSLPFHPYLEDDVIAGIAEQLAGASASIRTT